MDCQPWTSLWYCHLLEPAVCFTHPPLPTSNQMRWAMLSTDGLYAYLPCQQFIWHGNKYKMDLVRISLSSKHGKPSVSSVPWAVDLDSRTQCTTLCVGGKFSLTLGIYSAASCPPNENKTSCSFRTWCLSLFKEKMAIFLLFLSYWCNVKLQYLW